MKSLICLVISLAFLSTFAQAYLNFHYLEKPNGFDGPKVTKEPVTEGPKTTEPKVTKEPVTEGPKTTDSPFHRMAMVVTEVAQSPTWNSLLNEEKKVVAKFICDMVSYTPKFSPFGG